MKNTVSDCLVYCYIHQFSSQGSAGREGDARGEGDRKLSVEEQRGIAKNMLETAFLEFFGEEFQWGHVIKGEHGKPLYAGGKHFFNISHCHDGVAVAVAGVPVGVDMEGRRRVKALTVGKCMDGEEKAYIGEMGGEWLDKEQAVRFFRLWTLKESYVKMTGQGIRMPLNRICFSLGEWESAPEEGGIVPAGSRVLAPWRESSISCLLPVPDHALALTLGWERDLPPKITCSFSDAFPEARSGCTTG